MGGEGEGGRLRQRQRRERPRSALEEGFRRGQSVSAISLLSLCTFFLFYSPFYSTVEQKLSFSVTYAVVTHNQTLSFSSLWSVLEPEMRGMGL